MPKRKSYEGEYVRAEGDKTFWLVQGGKRIALRSKADWWDCGLRPVNVISADEVEAIPYSHDWGEESVAEDEESGEAD